MYACMHACMHVCMHACMHARMHACTDVRKRPWRRRIVVYRSSCLPRPRDKLSWNRPPQGGKGSKDLLHGFLEELKRFRGSRGEGQGEDEGEDEPEWSNDMLKAWAVREQKLRADAETS